MLSVNMHLRMHCRSWLISRSTRKEAKIRELLQSKQIRGSVEKAQIKVGKLVILEVSAEQV